jgi:hypothetical protein
MKKLIQKFQQELDIAPAGAYKDSIKKQILELKLSRDNKLSLTIKKNTMFKTPSQAIATIKRNVIEVSTPFDNDTVINAPIESVGTENKKSLKSMFKAFGDAYFA